MPRNTMEYSSRRQEEHRTDHEGEFNTEWQLQALQPFVDHLCHRDPELSQEIARELNAALNPTGEKHHVSWLDGHEQKTDGYNYQERHPTPTENNILTSYLETAHELDDDQKEYVSSTLTKALSQRATLTLSENFRKPMDHAASHQDNNVPNPESFNRLMDLAQDHYSKTLSHTEHVLKNSIKLSEDPMVFTKTIDSLIRLEKDMERAATGYIPQHLDMATAMDHFADTYIRRGEQLAEPIINDFREAFPGQEPNPTDPDFIQHFQEKTREYLPGDIHNAANHFAFQYAWNSPSSPDPNSPPARPGTHEKTHGHGPPVPHWTNNVTRPHRPKRGGHQGCPPIPGTRQATGNGRLTPGRPHTNQQPPQVEAPSNFHHPTG